MTIDTRVLKLITAQDCILYINAKKFYSEVYFTKDENKGEWVLNWKLDFIHYDLKRKWLLFWKKKEIIDTINFSVNWNSLNGSKELKDEIWYEYGLKGEQQ